MCPSTTPTSSSRSRTIACGETRGKGLRYSDFSDRRKELSAWVGAKDAGDLVEHPLLSLENPIECRIVQRINRFVVEVQIGACHYRAWINNTGRLLEFLEPGRAAFCLPRPSPGKTTHRLFAIRDGALGALIDTQFQMRALETCLTHGLLPWLPGCKRFKRNARLGASLIDYWIHGATGQVYLEVKSAALRHGPYASYPDCPSLRGRKHVQELLDHAAQGGKACIVFVAALPGAAGFIPNSSADASLSALLAAASRTGVDIRSIGMYYHPRRCSINLFDPDLPVDLHPQDAHAPALRNTLHV